MKKRHLQTIIFCAIGLAIWGSWYGWKSWKLHKALTALENVARSDDMNTLLTHPPEEILHSVDLAVRNLKILQGGSGQRSYALTAEWATVNQENGNVTVFLPDIEYQPNASKKDSSESSKLYAQSRLGRLANGNQDISMHQELIAQYQDKTIYADNAVFHNIEHILKIPNGAFLTSSAINGQLSKLDYDLNDNKIIGYDGVRVRYLPRSEQSDSDKNREEEITKKNLSPAKYIDEKELLTPKGETTEILLTPNKKH